MKNNTYNTYYTYNNCQIDSIPFALIPADKNWAEQYKSGLTRTS